MHLLDVNILIALGDSTHMHHRRVRRWFLSPECRGWATCPITENGFVRILGHPSYPDFNGGTQEARSVLQALTSLENHEFWPDDITIADETYFPSVPNSKHITDLYLLALSVRREAKLATLDRRIDPSLVSGGPGAYFLLPE